jgi:hypothetical protein
MLRNILGIVAGLVIGGVVNMGIVTLGPKIIPPPAGADMTTVEGLKAAMPRLEARHFALPFLAHALGTLVAALVAATIAVRNKMRIALSFGVLFLVGGIAAATMIPAPTWFIALDLTFAYIPMAWLGGRLGRA